MKKLVLTQGISWAWKSTWAKKEVEENWAIRFNKDEIRKEEEHFPAWYFFSKENEEVVMEVERERVENAMRTLEHPYIIVDNTHLDSKDWKENKHISFYKELAKKYWYEVEVKQFPITVEEAIIRDYWRPEDERVGEDVIRRMAKQCSIPLPYPANPVFKEWKEWLPTCIICDIDGTLAFMDWKRSPYDYSKVGGDRVNNMLYKLLNSISDWYFYEQHNQNKERVFEIFIVSWRKEECREETKEWLINNDIEHSELYMRADWDDRCDSIVKEEIYREYIEGKYNVLAVFDDRDRVVAKWRELGLPTYQVYYWCF